MYEEKYNDCIENYKNKATVYLTLVEKLKGEPLYITDWNNSYFNRFIWSLNLTSFNSPTKYTQYCNEICEYICKKEGIKFTKFYLTEDIVRYIDVKNRLSEK
jgi:hypothetical protein